MVILGQPRQNGLRRAGFRPPVVAGSADTDHLLRAASAAKVPDKWRQGGPSTVLFPSLTSDDAMRYTFRDRRRPRVVARAGMPYCGVEFHRVECAAGRVDAYRVRLASY